MSEQGFHSHENTVRDPEMISVNGVELPAKIVRDCLTPIMADVARVIGLEAAVKLVQEFGGRRFYLAGNQPPGSRLANCIGAQNAIALANAFGSGEMMFPRAAKLCRVARNTQLFRDHLAGVSCRALCERYDLSERQVWEILAWGRREQPAQPVRIPRSGVGNWAPACA